MAATKLYVTNQAPNAGTPVTTDGELAAGVYFVDTNDRSGVVDVKIPELLQFVVTAGAADVTVLVGPGDEPAAGAGGLGAVEHVVTAGTTSLVGPFESARVQSEHVNISDDGDPEVIVHAPVMVEIDGAASVAAFRFPRHT